MSHYSAAYALKNVSLYDTTEIIKALRYKDGDDTQEALKSWRSRRFRETDLLLSDVVESLDTDKPLIEVKPESNTRWIVFSVKTKEVATLAYAVIWAGGFDLNTGNYVPRGYTAPEGLQDRDIQHEISYKCQFSYHFETRTDTSIHDHIVRIEEHAEKGPHFNKGNHARREWQDGRTSISRRRYIATSPIFVKRTPYNSKDGGSFELPYEIHPWISQAVEGQKDKRNIPNPERPKYFEYSNNKLTELQDTNNPTFNRGDIVLVAFRLAFIVAGKPWFSEMIPFEFIRVATTSSNPSYASDNAAFPGHAKFQPLETGSILFPIDSEFDFAYMGNFDLTNSKLQVEATTGKRARTRSGTISDEEPQRPALKKVNRDVDINHDSDMMDIVKEGNTKEGLEDRDKAKTDLSEGGNSKLTKRQAARAAAKGNA